MFVNKFDGGDFLILLLYINIMLIVGQDPKKIGSLKKALSKSFAMKDMVLAKKILGMHIVQDRTTKLLWLSQEKYVIVLFCIRRENQGEPAAGSGPQRTHNKESTKNKTIY